MGLSVAQSPRSDFKSERLNPATCDENQTLLNERPDPIKSRRADNSQRGAGWQRCRERRPPWLENFIAVASTSLFGFGARNNQNENMNAKKELLDHIGDRKVKYVQVIREISYDDKATIEGTLDEVLPRLDFDYDDGYGGQELEGTIWYANGTWSDRGEYYGSEWWEHCECPSLPNGEAVVPRGTQE